MVSRTSVPAHPTNYYVGRVRPITYIVIHTGETDEGTTPAEGMGNWFAQEHPAGQRSSAHRGADTDSICTYVADGDTAFGAPNVNASGWHLEHAGRAGQTSAQWDDDASRLILANGALAAAEASQRLGVPARWLTDAELRAGNVKGFITHAQASRVLGGTHWDPGPNFPATRYMTLVRSHLGSPSAVQAPAPQEAGLAADDVQKVNDYTKALLLDGYTVAGQRKPALLDVLVETQRRVSRTEAALSALAKGLGPQVEAAVRDALSTDYDATVQLTPKVGP